MRHSSEEFEEIFYQYFHCIYSYLLSLCRNEYLAEELTQETFFQVLKSLPGFQGECKLLTWIYQIAKNVWFQHLRKENKISSINLDEDIQLISKGSTTEEAYMIKENKIQLYQNIRLLDDQAKEVVLMRLSGYLSFKEIGEIFGKSEAWARVTYHRARLKLKEGKRNE